MNIIAVDTSSDILHITLQTKTAHISQTQTIGKKFSEELVPRMVAICAEAQISLRELDLIVCSNGPGSFTGLRVGMAACKGIALAGGIPLVSLSTLEVFAYPLQHASMPVLVVLDAKKQRYYGALFQAGERLSRDSDATVGKLSDIIAPFDSVLLSGPDAGKLEPLLRDEVTRRGLSTKIFLDNLQYRDYGESMILLGKNLLESAGPDDIGSGPTYIRKSDAELSLEEKNGQTNSQGVRE